MDRVTIPALLRALADAVERGDADGSLDIERDPTVRKKPLCFDYRGQVYEVIDAGETWTMNIRTARAVARTYLEAKL